MFCAQANTYTVTTTADSGAGSLREAINQANLNPGADAIGFSFPVFPVKIVPLAPLPDILDSVVIDATISPDCLATYAPVVELDGSGIAAPDVNGLTALGTAALPIGVTIKGLAIHSFSGAGIMLQRNTNSVIQGNYLGTDLGGVLPFPNRNRGLVLDICTGVIVGGAKPCERNVISGNLGEGLGIYGGAVNRVVGNLVGLTANGLWPLPNGVGLSLVNCTQCQIGTPLPGEGNVISRNVQAGIQANGPLFVPMNTLIEGNFIGTLPNGASPAGNGGEGIFFFGGPTKITVRGNVIAWNGAQGVSVLEGIDNTIVENSIHDNGGLGIDITPVGVPNPNDPCDADTGPNRLQNYPILSMAAALGGTATAPDVTLQVDGVLESETGLTYRLDFYWSALCDPSGFGEGKHYIGQTTVSNTAPGCVTSFSAGFGVAVPLGSMITATATHPEGSTSEFSPCMSVVAASSNVVNHAGLPHTPKGSASLTELNGWLDVSSLNSGGSNGVRIALGRAQGWQGALDAFQLMPGDSLATRVLRDGGSNSIPLADARLSVGANGLTVGGHFNFSGPYQVQTLRLELRDDFDQLISSIRIPNGGEYSLPACTNGQDYIVCSNAYVSLHTGEPAFCWKFCSVVCIPPGPYPGAPVFPPVRTVCLVAEVPSHVTDGCALCPKVDTGTNQFAGTIVIESKSASASPGGTHLRLGQEWLQQFGQFHQSISNALFNGWAQPTGAGAQQSLSVVISSVAGVGPGGGRVALLLDRARYIGVDWDPTAASSASMPYRFGLLIGTNHISDSTVIQSSANGANINFTFPASGSATGRLDFYLRGQPVGSMNAFTSTVLFASGAPMRAAAATSPFTPVGTRGFAFYWPDAVSLVLAGTEGQTQADELRITPINPSNPLPWLTHLTIEADGLPDFEITGEATRPAVPGPLSIQRTGIQVLLSYPTEPGRPYEIDHTGSLSPTDWHPFDTFMGDGSVRQVSAWAGSPQSQTRFFRLSAF